jgi:hypothetical protein
MCIDKILDFRFLYLSIDSVDSNIQSTMPVTIPKSVKERKIVDSNIYRKCHTCPICKTPKFYLKDHLKRVHCFDEPEHVIDKKVRKQKEREKTLLANMVSFRYAAD